MIGRDIGEKFSHHGTHRPRQHLDQSGFLCEPHDTEPERHHAGERQGELHHGVFGALEGGFGDGFEGIVRSTDQHRCYNEAEPDVIEHGARLQARG